MPRLLCLMAAGMALLLPVSPCLSGIGAEYTVLEEQVAAYPSDLDARRRLARAYASGGFVEEAAEQYLAVLSLDPEEADTRSALTTLLRTRMPVWLPATVTHLKPFPVDTAKLSLRDTTQQDWELLWTASLDAHEGERADRLHHWSFPRVAYGYVWEQQARRWQMRVRVHHTEAAEIADASLRTMLALYAVVQAHTHLDPTGNWKTPVDLWLAEQGHPGGHSSGRSVYLYSIHTSRAPEEWLRELAHEYGHTTLPGIGGFTRTDDPWADGELGELLFLKWLAAAGADWLPWSVKTAEDSARPRREQLIAGANGELDLGRLGAGDLRARDYFLGLALKVEAVSGPRRLAETLLRCRRGTAAQFAAALERP